MSSKEGAALGARLRRLRLAKGLSQRDLAAPLYTAAYISTVEAGKRRPSRPALDHFAEQLGVQVDELLTGKPADLEARLEVQLNEARVNTSAGRVDRSRKILDAVRREAKRYGLIRYEARAQEGRARCLEHEERFEEARSLYKSIIEMLVDEPPTTRTRSTTSVARLAHKSGDSHYAIHLLERFLVELTTSNLPDPQSMMSAHAGLVSPYFDVGMRNRAALHAAEALKLVSDSHDPSALATMNLNVARVMLEEGRIKDAEVALGRAEEIFRTLDMRCELAVARLAHGYALIRTDRVDAAEPVLRSAIDTFEEVGRKVDRARAGNELARLLRLQGRGNEAGPMLERSLELLEGNDPNERAFTHREIALCAALGDPKKAEESLRRAIELFELVGDPVQIATSYALLGDLLTATGRKDDAGEAYRTGISTFVEPGDVFGSVA